MSVRSLLEPLEYYAERLHAAMAGAGTNDEQLMQLVVNHCEVTPRCCWK